jgi:two-component system OmpR family sensor kinase
VGALVIVLVLGVVAWWVIRLGIRPVREMTDVATAIAGGGLSHRVPDSNPHTEAGELGMALNRMLTSIEEAFTEKDEAETRLRQFVADASHELRTPVSTVRGYAELYRSGALDARVALDDAMRRTEQEAIRMGGLVDDLLTLANLDEGRPLEPSTVDLAAVATDAARDAAAVQPGRKISTEVAPDVRVWADEAKLRQVVANVLGNALTHTPERSPIVVRVAARHGDAVLEVCDGGPGMSADAAQRAFERFFRADPSRSRRSGGSGLGLAIVQSVVAAHGGSVRLDSSPRTGTSVRVELPFDTANRG